MPKYNVTICEIVGVTIRGIESESFFEALKLAVDSYNPEELFSKRTIEMNKREAVVYYAGNFDAINVYDTDSGKAKDYNSALDEI
jgi:hypothetical protein